MGTRNNFSRGGARPPTPKKKSTLFRRAEARTRMLRFLRRFRLKLWVVIASVESASKHFRVFRKRAPYDVVFFKFHEGDKCSRCSLLAGVYVWHLRSFSFRLKVILWMAPLTFIGAWSKTFRTSFAYWLQFVWRAARWEPKTVSWHETTRFIISWMRGRPIFSIIWYSATVNPLPKRLIAAFGGTIGIVKNQAYPSVALVSRAVTLTNSYDWVMTRFKLLTEYPLPTRLRSFYKPHNSLPRFDNSGRTSAGAR